MSVLVSQLDPIKSSLIQNLPAPCTIQYICLVQQCILCFWVHILAVELVINQSGTLIALPPIKQGKQAEAWRCLCVWTQCAPASWNSNSFSRLILDNSKQAKKTKKENLQLQSFIFHPCYTCHRDWHQCHVDCHYHHSLSSTLSLCSTNHHHIHCHHYH